MNKRGDEVLGKVNIGEEERTSGRGEGRVPLGVASTDCTIVSEIPAWFRPRHKLHSGRVDAQR